MDKWIGIAQVVVALLIVGLILLQERSGDGAGIIGGEQFSGFYQARRGLEKAVVVATVVAIVLFVGLALSHFIK